MKAKYAGKCSICELRFDVGADITKVDARAYAHGACAGQPIIRRECRDVQRRFKPSDGVWTAVAISRLLQADDRAVERAVVTLYKRQTAHEQDLEHTTDKNRRGFDIADAKRLTRSAKWILGGNRLSDWFLADARKRVLKYARQLAAVANAHPKASSTSEVRTRKPQVVRPQLSAPVNHSNAYYH